MHLICATHREREKQLHIIYTSKYFDSALFDWWMRTALLWQPARESVCVCVHENQNKWSCVRSALSSLSLSLSALRLHSNRMPQSSRVAAAASAWAAEGACPNAINARCTYATNVINLQARASETNRERRLQHFVACCSWANCAELFMALRQVAWPSSAGCSC